MDPRNETIFKKVLDELESKKKNNSDESYNMVFQQIDFVYRCLLEGKDISRELDGRELNFPVVSSRNFTDPEDEELMEGIDEITLLVSRL